MKRRRLPPRPPEPPPGHMYFYRQLTPITEVERHAQMQMVGFDALPREVRDAVNYGHKPRKRRTKT
jgi:hypothetical protein